DGVRRKLDFEAVAPCPWIRDAFLLASESVGALLRVHRSGLSEWVIPDLSEPHRSSGLFRHRHHGLEGFAYDKRSKTLWLLHERDPAGVAVYRWSASEEVQRFLRSYVSASPLPRRKARGDEWAELGWIGRRLYVLNRRQNAIERLQQHGEEESTLKGDFRWRFDETVSLPDTAFAHGGFGMASAFAVGKDRLWVAIDNNRSYLRKDPADRRARLLEFRRPQDL
ncbi:MAG: SdiA-regulated domain-containing protein, partial [Verrucomicrobiia bacterium]